MASPNTNHPLVGRRVLNVHRQDTRNPEAHRGKIEGIYEGCNALVAVKFDGSEFPSILPPNDLAFCELWPREGCRVSNHI